jgi:hypothetical protein
MREVEGLLKAILHEVLICDTAARGAMMDLIAVRVLGIAWRLPKRGLVRRAR